MFLLSCSTAGEPKDKTKKNIAEIFSTKINELGITIASDGIAYGGWKSALNLSGHDWKVYINGEPKDFGTNVVEDERYGRVHRLTYTDVMFYAKNRFHW